MRRSEDVGRSGEWWLWCGACAGALGTRLSRSRPRGAVVGVGRGSVVRRVTGELDPSS